MFGSFALRQLCYVKVVITDGGPVREICPSTLAACTLVPCSPEDCTVTPCNQWSLFGKETMHQPAWREPCKEALIAQLKRLYYGRHRADVESAKQQLTDHVIRWAWYKSGTAILQRLKALLERRNSCEASGGSNASAYDV